MQPNLRKLNEKKEETLAKKEKCYLDRGDAVQMDKIYFDINARLQQKMSLYSPMQKKHIIYEALLGIYTHFKKFLR